MIQGNYTWISWGEIQDSVFLKALQMSNEGLEPLDKKTILLIAFSIFAKASA